MLKKEQKIKREAEAVFAQEYKSDQNTIDFEEEDKVGAGQEDFFSVMKNSDFLKLDIKRLGTPREQNLMGDAAKKNLKGKKKEVSIYQRIKDAAFKRYGAKSTHAVLYRELAIKFLMGHNASTGDNSELKISIDALNKSDAKTFGHILEDFPILEFLQIWSVIINPLVIDRRDKMVTISQQL